MLTLSKNLTFSLTFLVVLLAFGLVMTPAFSHDEGGAFGVSFTPGELMDDVSTTDHKDITDIQVESGRSRASAYPTEIPNGPIGTWYQVDGTTAVTNDAYAPGTAGPVLSFSVDFAKVVQLYDVTADTVASVGKELDSKGALGLDDFTVDAYDDLFRSLGTVSLALRTQADGTISPTAANNVVPIAQLKFKTPRVTQIQDPGELPGRQFTLTIHNHALQNAYNVATGGQFEIHYLLITLKHNAAEDASFAALSKWRGASAEDQKKADFILDHSNGPHVIRVDLVEKDEGDPKYSKIVSGGLVSAADGDPGVVAITKVVERSLVSAVETGPFDIRIMLTEEPRAFTTDHIRVKNGTASNIRPLLPIPSPSQSATAGEANNPNTEVDGNFAIIAREVGLNYYSPGTVIPYSTSSPKTAATTERPAFSQITTATNLGTADEIRGLPGSSFPRATGRDNAYHLYAVTITPDYGVNGFVTISLNDLEDKVLPIPKRFDALTDAELVADTPQLSARVEAERSRRASNGREVLEVRVRVGAEPKSAATLAYEARDEVYKGIHNEIVLGNKLVVPAGGYLVLVADKGKAGIQDSPAKLKDKNTGCKEAIQYHRTRFTVPCGRFG